MACSGQVRAASFASVSWSGAVTLISMALEAVTPPPDLADVAPEAGPGAAAVVATLLAKRVAGRLSGAALSRIFAVLLLTIGIFVGVESLLGR